MNFQKVLRKPESYNGLGWGQGKARSSVGDCTKHAEELTVLWDREQPHSAGAKGRQSMCASLETFTPCSVNSHKPLCAQRPHGWDGNLKIWMHTWKRLNSFREMQDYQDHVPTLLHVAHRVTRFSCPSVKLTEVSNRCLFWQGREMDGQPQLVSIWKERIERKLVCSPRTLSRCFNPYPPF